MTTTWKRLVLCAVLAGVTLAWTQPASAERASSLSESRPSPAATSEMVARAANASTMKFAMLKYWMYQA